MPEAWKGNDLIRNSGDGTSFKPSLLEVASHGYLVLSNGAPGGSGSTTYKMGIESLDWLAKNAGQGKWANVDKTKVAVAGQSCGGLEAYKVGVDSRITTIGIMNSGEFSDSAGSQTAKTIKKPIFYFLGGSGDIAFKNVSLYLQEFISTETMTKTPRARETISYSTVFPNGRVTWLPAQGLPPTWQHGGMQMAENLRLQK